VAFAILLALVVAAAAAGFGIYSPRRGETAAGDARHAQPQWPRDMATVEVRRQMAGDQGEPPTLADVVGFFALEDDTLACTLVENDETEPLQQSQEIIRRLARKRLSVGATVKLCLNG
jgi:hypothetical protein